MKMKRKWCARGTRTPDFWFVAVRPICQILQRIAIERFSKLGQLRAIRFSFFSAPLPSQLPHFPHLAYISVTKLPTLPKNLSGT